MSTDKELEQPKEEKAFYVTNKDLLAELYKWRDSA